MIRAFILLVVASSSLWGQAIGNKWFVVDAGSFHNSEQGCFKPANVSVSSGLTISAKLQSVSCGDSSDAPAPFAYTTGTVISNSPVVTVGDVVAFQVTSPSGQASGLWPTIWFQEQNCPNKLGWTYSALSPSCNWPQPGSEEVDAFEMFYGTAIDQELHYYDGGLQQSGCGGISGAPGASYAVTMTWTAGSMVFTINGSTSCTIASAFVPTNPMYIVLNLAVGGVSGDPSTITFPQAISMQYVRVCPPGTTAAQCAASPGYATVFDDEFNGTGPMPSVFVGQTFNGNATGLDCADSFGVMNGQQVSWINDPGYWTDGQIGPGTTVTTCGAISSTLVANGSGMVTSPITFTNSGAVPRFSLNGQHYINLTWLNAGSAVTGATPSGKATIQ